MRANFSRSPEMSLWNIQGLPSLPINLRFGSGIPVSLPQNICHILQICLLFWPSAVSFLYLIRLLISTKQLCFSVIQLILQCFSDSRFVVFFTVVDKWFYFCIFTAGQRWWTSGSGAKRTGRQAVSCRGKCSGMLILVIPVKFCHLFIAVQFSLSFNFLRLEIFWEQSFCGRMTTAVCSITIFPLIPSPNLSSHSFGLLKSLRNGSVKGAVVADTYSLTRQLLTFGRSIKALMQSWYFRHPSLSSLMMSPTA